MFCPVTSRVKGYPFEMAVPAGLPVSGVVLCEQGGYDKEFMGAGDQTGRWLGMSSPHSGSDCSGFYRERATYQSRGRRCRNPKRRAGEATVLLAFFTILSFALSVSVSAEGYPEVVASFGTTRTLSGAHHAKTLNPDGTSINFWASDFEGQPAVGVSLSNPHIAAADAYGNVYIADKAGQAILKISADGTIHTFAGTHVVGFNGDGPARATTLQISNPNGLYVLPNGVVFFLDPGNHRIRRVDLDGQMTTVVNDPDPNWAPSGRALWVSRDERIIYYTHEYPPVPPSLVAMGAVVKKWTRQGGIETVCNQAVGFGNPGNIDVNPIDGKLYVTDRGEEDTTKMNQGLFRIDGMNQRTRMTGDASKPGFSEGKSAIKSFIEEPRGIAFRADGSYFICGHRDGSVWFVDVAGGLHQYVNGAGKKDSYLLADGQHPPLIDKNYISQPRSVTLAPDGDLLIVSNDSGYVFRVENVAPADVSDLRLRVVGTAVELNWKGVLGRGYRIERTLDLRPGTWSPVTAVGGSFGTTTYQDSLFLSDSPRFYRILPAL